MQPELRLEDSVDLMDTPTVASTLQGDDHSLSDEEIFDENLRSMDFTVDSINDAVFYTTTTNLRIL